MAEHMTGMLVEETLINDTGAKHGQGRRQRLGAIGMVAATFTLLLIGGAAMHSRTTSHPVAPAIPLAPTSGGPAINRAERSALLIAAAMHPVVTGGRQQFLDVNTAWLPAVSAELAPSGITTITRRFLEVNTTNLPSDIPVPAATTPQQRQCAVQAPWSCT
jgi:hypothetical protein